MKSTALGTWFWSSFGIASLQTNMHNYISKSIDNKPLIFETIYVCLVILFWGVYCFSLLSLSLRTNSIRLSVIQKLSPFYSYPSMQYSFTHTICTLFQNRLLYKYHKYRNQ